ncbi:MAG: repressor LexA [Rubrobacter sp.]|jgi:repressor LexA|nr:repressor LexA [Rubrobacter sp.]MDQ3361546.1 transcriptional repressor LexA [Actinomycetota bacterium]
MTRENWGKRLEILRHLARGETRGGGAPSVREVGAAVGLSSKQTAHKHLKRLEEHGYVERGEGWARALRLTRKGWEVVGVAPLLGRTAAGHGLEAVPNEGEFYSLGAELMASRSGRGRYLLRVVGESMLEAHIADGDIVVVEEDESPPDGEVVVALLRGGEEVTIKRLYREGDLVRLKSQSEGYEDALVPADEVRVQGRVVQVVHPPRRP